MESSDVTRTNCFEVWANMGNLDGLASDDIALLCSLPEELGRLGCLLRISCFYMFLVSFATYYHLLQSTSQQ